jgi:hypothetical protein
VLADGIFYVENASIKYFGFCSSYIMGAKHLYNSQQLSLILK